MMPLNLVLFTLEADIVDFKVRILLPMPYFEVLNDFTNRKLQRYAILSSLLVVDEWFLRLGAIAEFEGGSLALEGLNHSSLY